MRQEFPPASSVPDDEYTRELRERGRLQQIIEKACYWGEAELPRSLVEWAVTQRLRGAPIRRNQRRIHLGSLEPFWDPRVRWSDWPVVFYGTRFLVIGRPLAGVLTDVRDDQWQRDARGLIWLVGFDVATQEPVPVTGLEGTFAARPEDPGTPPLRLERGERLPLEVELPTKWEASQRWRLIVVLEGKLMWARRD